MLRSQFETLQSFELNDGPWSVRLEKKHLSRTTVSNVQHLKRWTTMTPTNVLLGAVILRKRTVLGLLQHKRTRAHVTLLRTAIFELQFK
jgi:hypothetical protein